MREKTLTVRTSAREEIVLITDDVQRALAELTDGEGICTRRSKGKFCASGAVPPIVRKEPC